MRAREWCEKVNHVGSRALPRVNVQQSEVLCVYEMNPRQLL